MRRNVNKKGEKYLNLFRFSDAIEKYEKVLEKNPDNLDAKQNLATIYRLTNQPDKAKYWYSWLVESGNASAEDHLHYGNALHSNGKFEEAKAQYEKYAELNPSDSRGLRLAEGCDLKRTTN